ncbi:MAG: hypothetical protein Q4A05_01405 [Ruminococcus sp.]|nr:hypothetical protein [Ruminococcus sp.]
MEYKRILASALTLTLAAAVAGCGDKGSSSESSEATTASTEPSTVEATEATTEELEPPKPVEASDPNAITFDDGDFSFASPKTTDDDSAQGTLEVVEVQGNKMLRFTDDGNNHANGTVQKIQIDAVKLLSHENVAKVRSIQFDVYADATASDFKNDDGELLKAPGWIGGGGGANVAGDKWYQFGEWSGGEYNFEMSGAAHAEFKFVLAAGGQCWDETMEEAVFLIMRWGAQNEGNMYVDNIVFYDENGDSLPIEKTVDEALAAADQAEAEARAELEAALSGEQEAAVDKAVDDGIAAAEEALAEAQSKADEAIAEASSMIAAQQ